MVLEQADRISLLSHVEEPGLRKLKSLPSWVLKYSVGHEYVLLNDTRASVAPENAISISDLIGLEWSGFDPPIHSIR